MASKTLSGLQVVVTRTRAQASVLRADLERRGAEVIEIAALELVDLEGWEAKVFDVPPWDWTVITSKNAAERIARQIRSGRGPHEQLGRIAATGAATARYLQNYGLSPQLVPERYIAESLAEALIERGVEGARVVLPRAEVARAVLPDRLRAAGAHVVDVPVYRAIIPKDGVQRLRDASGQEPNLVTFASSKTAHHFAALLQECELERWMQVPTAAIGPVTAQAARELGFEVVAIPERHTIADLVQAIEDWYRAARDA